MKLFNLAVSTSIAAVLLSFSLMSCVNQVQDDSEIIGNENEKVKVHVSFSGFNLSYEEDNVATRASDKTASDAGVDRIALSVFDSSNQLVYSSKKKSSDDTEDFDQISCELMPGNYTFVAVAHKASADSDEAASITSATEATITTSKVLKTFAVTQAVTVQGGETNAVTIVFGQRITSTFQLVTSDNTPDEVTSCELLVNPELTTTTTAFTFSPSTGLAADDYQNRTEINRIDIKDNTFKNVALIVHCFLKGQSQTISVTANMKNASGGIVKSKMFTDVPMAPHRITRATGQFFHGSANGSFTFDDTDDTRYDFSF